VYRAWSGVSDAGTDISYEEISRGYNMGLPFQYKFGGNMELRAESGGGVISVSYNIDDSGWVLLGTCDTAGGSGLTFPLTFPLAFGDIGLISDRFHLDKTGLRWKKIQFKFSETSSDTVSILDNSVLTFVDEYQQE
jgi:hypothetical protein